MAQLCVMSHLSSADKRKIFVVFDFGAAAPRVIPLCNEVLVACFEPCEGDVEPVLW